MLAILPVYSPTTADNADASGGDNKETKKENVHPSSLGEGVLLCNGNSMLR